jgi:hypothetical protein
MKIGDFNLLKILRFLKSLSLKSLSEETPVEFLSELSCGF